MKQLILLILLALSLSAGAQKTYYVKVGGKMDGTAWDKSNGNLQAVLNKAASGDQVYVAAGTYTGGFVMREGVAVLGGFPSGANNKTTLAERKLPGTGANLTILDGRSQMRVLTQEKDFTKETLWEGFVIQNGNASGNVIGTIVYGRINTTEPAGIVFAYDAVNNRAKMIALEEESKQWGPQGDTTGATDLADGAKNWETINIYITTNTKNWNDYPVWNYIKDLRESKSGGYDDWYLPAIQELGEVYAQRHVLNAVLKGIDKSELQNVRVWSGSENLSDIAWSVHFSDGDVRSNNKLNQSHARAVLLLSLNDLTISSAKGGGGAYLKSQGILRNSLVKNCQASVGGGVYLNKKARLEGCVVEHCVAKEASAVYVVEEANVLSSTVVNNNVDRTPQYSVAPPKIGDYYYADGTWGADATNAIGIVCFINFNNPYSGYILHKAEISNKSDWDTCMAWAKGLGGDWQPPMIDVLQSIYSNMGDLNTKIEAIGGTTLSNNYYCSDSEGNSDSAWVVTFADGNVNSYGKGYQFHARAVRVF